MSYEINGLDLRMSIRLMMENAAGDDGVVDAGSEQGQLPVFAQNRLDERRMQRPGEDIEIWEADDICFGGLKIQKQWDRLMAASGSNKTFGPDDLATIEDGEFRTAAKRIYELAVAHRQPYVPGEHRDLGDKFEARKETVLADQVLEKSEAKKLRKVALAEFNTSESPADIADAFVAALRGMYDHADPKTQRYLDRAIYEFEERGRHQRVAYTICDYLRANADSLSPELRGIDATDVSAWKVGATMQGDVWLQAKLKEGVHLTRTRDALRSLFRHTPELQRYGAVTLSVRR